jgi:hypothetical protein
MSSNTNPHLQNLISSAEQIFAETPDLNYSYVPAGMPGHYVILKRSAVEPLRNIPLLHLNLVTPMKFLDIEDVLASICEKYAKEEHEWRKANKEREDE